MQIPSFRTFAVGLFLLLLLGDLSSSRTGVQAAVPLPSEFAVVIGSTGVELVFTPAPVNASATAEGITGGGNSGSPNTAPVIRIGGSRPEFRVSNGTLLGYPYERPGPSPDGTLVLALALTQPVQDLLEASGGQDLQVWSSGRRLDVGGRTASANNAGNKPFPSLVAPTPTPTIAVDPAAKGIYSTLRLSYNLFPRVPAPDFVAPMEVVAEVTYPNKTLPPKTPLVLFLHGRHSTCYKGSDSTIDWPCTSGYKPIPSHQGYRYVADILASQGYLVVSISANGVNGQDCCVSDNGVGARSILVRHHLALWANWTTNGGDPWNSKFKGTVDMTKVVLVGHSRGGEGVNRAAVDAKASDPYKIVGLVSYGPTVFGRQVTPDIHSATILPTCDGDVSDLQGQAYIDGSRDIAYSPALRSAVIAVGCNHNYFNTEWTPGLAKAPANDDWYDDTDPVCGATAGSVRLTPQEQQVVGAAYTTALVRLAVRQEASVLPLLDGSYVRPASIGRAEVATHAVGGAGYRLLYRAENSGAPVLALGMLGGECLGYLSGESGSQRECYPDSFGIAPHWLRHYYDYNHPSPRALSMRWTKAGATATFRVAKSMRNLTALDYVDVRVANDPTRASGAVLELLIRDTQGRNASLNVSLATIEGWPGTGGLDRVHARALRGSLASVPTSTVDLQNVVDVVLVSKSASGKVYVLDISASQAKISVPKPLNLPVVSVDQVSAKEGNGFNTAKLKIRGDRPLTTKGSIWVETAGLAYKLNLVPSSSKVIAEFPVSWIGDDIYSGDSTSQSVVIGAMTGVLTGTFLGGLTVVEDEKPPNLIVKQKVVTANEGKSLEWNFELSAPTAGYTLTCSPVPLPKTQTELSSSDVPTSWLRSVSFSDPPSVPTSLSTMGLYLAVRFDYGITKAKLLVPIASDNTKEGDEWVRIKCEEFGSVVVGNLTLWGKVPAAN